MSTSAKFLNDEIELSISVRATDAAEFGAALGSEEIYRSIIESPWAGNKPLSECIKSGERFSGGFNLRKGPWLEWEFIMKGEPRKRPKLSVLKSAISSLLQSNGWE